jgi:hypothetical protein
MHPQTDRSLDALLVIGRHPLDTQFRALAAYAARTGHLLDLVWTVLPDEDPASDVPRSGFPVVVFDDEIAGFSDEEYEPGDDGGDPRDAASMDWHVAHAVPQPKSPTTHLPVYGYPASRETAADAVLRIGRGSLDRQLALIEAFSLRSAIRLQGVYVARDADGFRAMLRDFAALNRARGGGTVLSVGAAEGVEVHR